MVKYIVIENKIVVTRDGTEQAELQVIDYTVADIYAE